MDALFFFGINQNQIQNVSNNNAKKIAQEIQTQGRNGRKSRIRLTFACFAEIAQLFRQLSEACANKFESGSTSINELIPYSLPEKLQLVQ